MALHRLTTALVAGALALSLAACGGDPKPAASSGTPTPTTTASPSPTGPVAPVLPELAGRNDAVGAKAFLKYWFAAVTYAMKTGDTRPFMAVSAKSCSTCKNLQKEVRAVYGAHRHLVGGGWEVAAIEQDPSLKPPFFRFGVKVRQPQQRVVDASGKVVSKSPPETFLFLIGVQHLGAFQVHGVERADD